MTTWPLTRIGNTLSRYTRSPLTAVLVLTLLIILRGMRVPIVTTNSSGFADSVRCAGAVGAGPSGAEAGGDAGDGAGSWAHRTSEPANASKAGRRTIWNASFQFKR